MKRFHEEFELKVSTSSKDGSIKFSVIAPWAIRSIIDSNRKGL
jgi:hypothetical protein